jgi:microcystin-dependent protein
MTISSTSNRNNYVGNDSTPTYTYGYRIFLNSDLQVIVTDTTLETDTTLVLTTDYTVSGVGDLSGGDITLTDVGQAWISATSNLDTAFDLSIRRLVPLTQLTDIRNQGAFFPEIHEDTFDKSLMINQQQQDEIDRCIRLPDSQTASDLDPTLPVGLVGTPGVTIITNVTGDGFDVGPNATDIAAAQPSAAAAAASASAALVSENAVAADLVLTNADVVTTNADAVITQADAVTTQADAIITQADAVTTQADAIITQADAVTTQADAIITQADAVTTQADVVLTNADVVSSAASAAAALVSELAAAASAAGLIVPSGALTPFTGTSAPTGYLFCDGASVSRTTYADLYAVIGNAYGTADGASFNVPDTRGKFLRGVDGGATNDPDRAARTAQATGGNTGDNVGSIQGHEVVSHDHDIAGGYSTTNSTSGVRINDSTNLQTSPVKAFGGNETRPINVSVNYLIKI